MHGHCISDLGLAGAFDRVGDFDFEVGGGGEGGEGEGEEGGEGWEAHFGGGVIYLN